MDIDKYLLEKGFKSSQISSQFKVYVKNVEHVFYSEELKEVKFKKGHFKNVENVEDLNFVLNYYYKIKHYGFKLIEDDEFCCVDYNLEVKRGEDGIANVLSLK